MCNIARARARGQAKKQKAVEAEAPQAIGSSFVKASTTGANPLAMQVRLLPHRRYQAGDKECREPVVKPQVVGEPAY